MYNRRQPSSRREPARQTYAPRNAPQDGAGFPRSRQNAQRRPWEEELLRDNPELWDEPSELPPEPGWDEPFQPYDEPEQPREIIATNRVVCLTATLAALCSLFALFLIFAEKKSRAIRLYAVQSAGLSACHLILAAALLAVGLIMGAVPYVGFLMNLVCWIVYLAALVVMVCLRVRMMQCAYAGVHYGLPVIGRWLERFV